MRCGLRTVGLLDPIHQAALAMERREPAKPLPADDFVLPLWRRLDDLIVETVLRSLRVTVLHAFFDHMLQVTLADN
jgi:hypothetical protein